MQILRKFVALKTNQYHANTMNIRVLKQTQYRANTTNILCLKTDAVSCKHYEQ